MSSVEYLERSFDRQVKKRRNRVYSLFKRGWEPNDIARFLSIKAYMVHEDLDIIFGEDPRSGPIKAWEIARFAATHPKGSKCFADISVGRHEDDGTERVVVKIEEKYGRYAKTDKGCFRWIDLVIANRDV